MKSMSLFQLLEAANEKPAIFSVLTAKELWTDEHTSKQMLAYHLNEALDVSSRRSSFIDKSVQWMTEHFDLSSKRRIADFGCGPGLYTSRLARTGAEIVGIDFSRRSLEYARGFAEQHKLTINYIEADYLDYDPEGKFDLIIMIMCDFCALSPAQRGLLLARFKSLLSENGRIVLDVYSLNAFAEKTETSTCEKNQLDGFWSGDPYYAIASSFRYETEKVSLDKYTIIEQERFREIYNWLQHYSPEMLREELHSNGLVLEEIYGDVAGKPYKSDKAEFAVVIKANQ